MKKIFAFVLAFVFCFLCFGTYGFENAIACTEDHDHGMQLHAASSDITMVAAVESDYDASDEELKVTINFSLYDDDKNTSFDLDDNVVIKIWATSTRLDNKADIKVVGDLFGVSATVDSSGYIIFDADENGADLDNFSGGEIEITFKNVDPDDFTTKSTRATTLRISVTGEDINNNDIDLEATSYTIYVCEHRSGTVESVLVAATCAKSGTSALNCVDCGCLLYTDIIFPLKHEYDYTKPFTNIYAYKAPTCEATGYGQFKCLLCETMDTVVIPKTDHTYGESKLNADGKYQQTCSICGNVRVSDCNHTFKYTKVVTPATCKTKGVDLYTCTKCDITENRTTDYADHNYGTWKTTKVSTCETAGERTRTCSVCGYVQTEKLELAEHDYGTWKTIEESTCISDGLKRRTCSECGAKDDEAIEKSGHKYGGWSMSKAPTCLETGLNERTCSVCKAVDTEVLDKAAHRYGDWVVEKAATCVATGVEKHVCSVCSDTETRTVAINADAHAWGEWKALVVKSCISNGESSRTCTLCNKVETRIDEATGHTFGPATLDGKTTVKSCSCGYTESVKTNKKGTEKTLTDYSGSLVVTGTTAEKDVLFEIGAMTIDTEAEYKKYITFDKGYTYKVLVDGAEAPITADMTLTLEMDASFDDYEVSLAILKGGSFLMLGEYERDGREIEIEGSELVGTNSIFIIKGEEQSPNIVLPIVITVAVLAIAGVAVFVIMSKSKSKNTFN